MSAAADTPVDEGPVPRRADAVRNREKVIGVAEQVFAEQGIEAGIPEIAERAGVGKGTIYRNFETKDDLVAAVLTRRLLRLDGEILEALELPDPGQAIREVLGNSAARTSALSFPPGIYLPGRHPALDEAKEQVKENLGELFSAAQSAGQIRAGRTIEELFVIFGGTCRLLADSGETDPDVWRHHSNIVLDAFRPDL